MVGKALRLLTLLGEHPHGASMSELSRIAGYPVSTTHRLLGSLVRDGYAEVDEQTRRYSIGLRVFALGRRVSDARGFSGAALPILRPVSERTGEATLLSVRDGHHQLYVHYVEGPRRVRVVGQPGARGPLHCTAMGKVLIAYAPPEQREQLLDTLELPSLGPGTITDRAQLRRQIAEVARLGHAVADEEHEAGIRAVAVPVLSGSLAFAAISTAVPAFRMSMDQLTGECLPVLEEAARHLASVLPIH